MVLSSGRVFGSSLLGVVRVVGRLVLLPAYWWAGGLVGWWVLLVWWIGERLVTTGPPGNCVVTDRLTCP